MKRNKKKKSRFINLAEQLTLQNEIVSSTMDSMLEYVNDESVEERSDCEQIKKTADQTNELNPIFKPLEIGTKESNSVRLPRPKMNSVRSGQKQS